MEKCPECLGAKRFQLGKTWVLCIGCHGMGWVKSKDIGRYTT